jgi:hypothetical protein
MKLHEHTPDWGSVPALHPGLVALIDRGVLSRADEDESFAVELDEAVSRGDVTPSQAHTLGQMIGA